MSNDQLCIESFGPYGQSGSGKTTQVLEFAVMVHKRTGKKTRLNSCTGGGWTSITPAIEIGIVDPVNLRGRYDPFYTLSKLSQGWKILDPTDPKSPLVPPSKQEDWKDIGGIAFDDITTTSRWVMNRALQHEAGVGTFLTPEGKEKPIWMISAEKSSAKFEESGEWFSGSAARAHYGVIQQHMEMFVADSCAIEGRYIMWTAMETEGKSVGTIVSPHGILMPGSPIHCPDLIGDKVNAYIPSWFKNCVHLQVVNGEHCMFLKNHADPGTNNPYLCKTRASAGFDMPLVLKGREASIENLMNLLEKSHEVGLNSLRGRLKK